MNVAIEEVAAPKDEKVVKYDTFLNKRFVLAGSFPTTNKHVRRMIVLHGGEHDDKLSVDTDYFIVGYGYEDGTKHKRFLSLNEKKNAGIQLITYDEFIDAIDVKTF
ncbi:BRCT domain-containing protein [Lysinibacillus sphaericus]|uniref:BRCT domain-containing protein n=1 Tax=Lysinibacillus sphaericus TaxID=1421 RepID=UPI0019D54D2D|nr:BRCT domain-containing protein [Lysinibacillus sphaericus]